MVDETTFIATLQQYITFVQYLNTKRCQETAFINIRRVDACGAIAANLFRLWNDAADYDLDVRKHVVFARDGATAIIGRRNSLSQKLTHTHTHTQKLQHIQDLERGLDQTRRFFSNSQRKAP